MAISAQRAIKNYCKGCIYDPKAGGTWVEQVENCTVTKCELYDHRPLTQKTKKAIREKFIASLTVEQQVEIENKANLARETLAKFKRK